MLVAQHAFSDHINSQPKSLSSGALPMDAECSSKILVTIYQTKHNTTEDGKINIHYSENL
jgi:hypothetical protein